MTTEHVGYYSSIHILSWKRALWVINVKALLVFNHSKTCITVWFERQIMLILCLNSPGPFTVSSSPLLSCAFCPYLHSVCATSLFHLTFFNVSGVAEIQLSLLNLFSLFDQRPAFMQTLSFNGCILASSNSSLWFFPLNTVHFCDMLHYYTWKNKRAWRAKSQTYGFGSIWSFCSKLKYLQTSPFSEKK